MNLTKAITTGGAAVLLHLFFRTQPELAAVIAGVTLGVVVGVIIVPRLAAIFIADMEARRVRQAYYKETE